MPPLRFSRRCCAALAVVALTMWPLNAGYAFHWPWQKEKEAKASSKPSASQKPAAAEKSRAEKKLASDDKPAFKCDPTTFRIIVDVGHTQESDGAISARNVPEFQFNLRLAKRVVDELKSNGFPETRLLVTTGKARPSLGRRVAAADALKGNFLLSIHHDSVPDKFMEKWNFEGKPSYFSDRFSGYSVFVSHSNEDFQTSFTFARLLGRQMKAQGLQYAAQYTQAFMGGNQHELLDKDVGVYRYDRLIVLMYPQMPAVLLEAGSIINRDEELKMASPERQAMTAKAVTAAMKQFCGVQPPPVVEAKSAPPVSTQPAASTQPQLSSSQPQASAQPQASNPSPPPTPARSEPQPQSQPDPSSQSPAK